MQIKSNALGTNNRGLLYNRVSLVVIWTTGSRTVAEGKEACCWKSGRSDVVSVHHEGGGLFLLLHVILNKFSSLSTPDTHQNYTPRCHPLVFSQTLSKRERLASRKHQLQQTLFHSSALLTSTLCASSPECFEKCDIALQLKKM